MENSAPFCYESTGAETFFTSRLDPDHRSRRVFSFHRPETLLAWVQQEKPRRPTTPRISSARARFSLACPDRGDQQIGKILLQRRSPRPHQMATGSGKTYTAVNFIYRLVKYAGAKRVLFLVDRGNLGRQTLKEFQQFVSPANNYKFTGIHRPASHQQLARHLRPRRHRHDPARLFHAQRRADARAGPRRPAHRSRRVPLQDTRPGRIQPRVPDRGIRLHHHRRVPPLDLQSLAAGARIL